jgi:hypothetical protein
VDRLISAGLRQGERAKSAIREVDIGDCDGPHARQRRRPSPLPRRRALRLARLPRLIGQILRLRASTLCVQQAAATTSQLAPFGGLFEVLSGVIIL